MQGFRVTGLGVGVFWGSGFMGFGSVHPNLQQLRFEATTCNCPHTSKQPCEVGGKFTSQLADCSLPCDYVKVPVQVLYRALARGGRGLQHRGS